jgi:hypothetical protein
MVPVSRNSTRLVNCLLIAAAAACAQQASEKVEFFEARIRPVLQQNCYSCHTDTKLGW